MTAQSMPLRHATATAAARPTGQPPAVNPEVGLIGDYLRRPQALIFSYEFLLAGLIVVVAYKQSPNFAWLFPIDGTLLLFALNLAFVATYLARHGVRKAAATPIVLYLLFVVWVLASAFWTKAAYLEPLQDFVTRVLLINGLIFVAAVAIVARSRARTVRFLLACTLLALPLAIDYILAAGSFVHVGKIEGRQYSNVGRIVGIGFVTLFAFMLFLRPLTKKWLLCLGMAGLLFYCMLLLGSRQTFVAAFIQIIVVLMLSIHVIRGRIHIRVAALPALLMALGVVAALVILVQSGSETWTLRRLSRLIAFAGGDTTADGSALARVHYAHAAILFWSDTWASVLVGDGLFSFPRQLAGRFVDGVHPHNLILAILTEHGVIGLGLFGALVLSLLLPSRVHADRRSPVRAALITLVIGAAFRAVVSGDIESSFVVLVYLALLAAPEAEPNLPRPARAPTPGSMVPGAGPAWA